MVNGEKNGKYSFINNLFDNIIFLSVFSEYLDASPIEPTLRQRFGPDPSKFDGPTSSALVDVNHHQGALPRIVLWGVTLTISGLAIYIWNHTQRTDPAAFISLGDFLAQLYGK
jgi:hypothetical protein